MKIFCDTSVLVAASVDNHPHHPEADAVLNRIYAGDDSGHASAHTLAETFSVLSRMPSQPKLDPQAALKILEDLIPHFAFVPLAVGDYLRSIRELTALKLGGGRVYDLLHLHAAGKAGVDRIYTFNAVEWKKLVPSLAASIHVPPAVTQK